LLSVLVAVLAVAALVVGLAVVVPAEHGMQLGLRLKCMGGVTSIEAGERGAGL